MKHLHHIIPKHAGGSDDPSNLIELTIEEHANAHYDLFRKYGRWQDELAWKALSGQIGKEETIKEKLINAGKSVKGLKRSDVTRSKISKGLIGLERSEEHKKNISISKTGKKHTKEHIQNIKDGLTDEIRKNISNSLKSHFKENGANGAKRVTLNGVTYKSIKEAYEMTGISKHKIRKVGVF